MFSGKGSGPISPTMVGDGSGVVVAVACGGIMVWVVGAGEGAKVATAVLVAGDSAVSVGRAAGVLLGAGGMVESV